MRRPPSASLVRGSGGVGPRVARRPRANIVTASAKSPPFDPDRDCGQLPALAPRPGFQFRLRTLFVAVLWIALACTVVVWFRQDPLPSPLYDPARWPRPLQEIVALAGERGIELGKIRVVRSDREMWNEDYAWQTDASAALIEQLVSRWNLVPVAGPNRRVDEFWRMVPEDWRRPSAAAAKEFWISQSWVDGKSCCRYVVLHDRAHGKLYVWYHFIF